MRSSGACLLAFHSLIASTLAFSPFVRRFDEPVWTPARQTGAPGDEQLDEEGWSPRPTDSPQPDFGELDLFKRASFSLGTDTCGFVSGYSSAPVTCVKESAYCTNDGVGNMDCCTGAYTDCTSTMYSACLDYTASLDGACNSKGLRTICCWSASPSCYTLLFSTSASPGLTFSILECQDYGGLDTLLATPPDFTATANPTTTTSSSTSTTTTSSAPTTTSSSNSGGGGSTPVGAIVGGVVGGVAVIGIVATAIFFLVLRSRRQSAGASTGSPSQPPPPGQQPPMGQTSPVSGAGYPSPGPQYQQQPYGGPPQQQQYGPESGMYKQPDAYGAGTPAGYFPTSPQPGAQNLGPNGSYTPHQSIYGYPPPSTSPVGGGYPGPTPPPVGSPGPNAYGAYGAQGGGFPQNPQGHSQVPVGVAQLDTQNPVGTEGHRAELS